MVYKYQKLYMYFSDRIQKLIGEIDSSPSTVAAIKRAAHRGRTATSSERCDKFYPVCKELGVDGVYAVPVLLPSTHPLYYDHEKARMIKK
jgi:hypothetical protein